MQELHRLVGNLFERMSKIQDNLVEIKEVMKDWSAQPLFERKEGKKVRYSMKSLFCNSLESSLRILVLIIISLILIGYFNEFGRPTREKSQTVQ